MNKKELRWIVHMAWSMLSNSREVNHDKVKSFIHAVRDCSICQRMKADVVIVDPNTSSQYVKAFHEEPGLTVIEVPSSLGEIPGAQNYSALCDNMIQALLKNAKRP